MSFKDMMKKNPKKFGWILRCYNKILGGNHIRVSGSNRLSVGSSLMKKVTIRVDGEHNEIVIADLVQMDHLTVQIHGNNNRLVIGAANGFDHCSLWLEDDGNSIEVGEHNRFFEGSQLAALEGTNITIGADGLFAGGVQVRTSDSHSVLNAKGERINAARDIKIGNHVWLGDSVMVLKGSVIPENVIVGARSLVNKVLEEANGMYAGTPARLIKSDVNWTSERV
ncbi:MAG: acyltransferase [Lachnospiraceae bacterium]